MSSPLNSAHKHIAPQSEIWQNNPDMTHLTFSSRLLPRLTVAQFAGVRIHPTALRVAVHGFLITAVILITGCGKSPTPQPATQSAIGNRQSAILTLHWLGKKRLSAEPNATNFVSIWNMPESRRLESQTLDKLSTAPWRLWSNPTALSNAPTALLRPLLDDLVQEETYIEVVSGTNQPTETVLAIKLPPDRAALWQTNLPVVLKSIFGEASEAKSPSGDYQLSTKSHQLTLGGTNGWTLLSISDIRLQASGFRLLPQAHARLGGTGSPFVPDTTNNWVSGRVDFSWVSRALGWQGQSDFALPKCEFSAIGDGANVRSRVGLEFDKPVPLDFNGWNIPTNIINDQLISFTAFRMPEFDVWKNFLKVDLGVCFSRKQMFVWALRSLPMATYVAVPTDPGSPCFESLGKHLYTEVNDWIATNAIGSFAPSETGNMITWQGAPFMSAYFQSLDTASGSFVIGGLVPTPLTNRAPNLELANRMMQRANLVYYDWEYSAPRVESWFYIGQLGRVLFGRAQMPTSSDSVTWLKAVGPKLGSAGTVATSTDPTHISVERFSTLGLTAVELHLFADWLQSTNFPADLHTTSSPPRPMLRRKTPLPGAPN